jgi:hypothetical protein
MKKSIFFVKDTSLCKQKRWIFFICLVCLFFSFQWTAYSQRLYERDLLQYYLNQKNLEYNCPEGWIESFVKESKLTAGSTCYRIETPEHNVMIIFGFPPFSTKEDSAKFAYVFNKMSRVKYSRNEQYIAHAKAVADTTGSNRITYYDREYSEQIFNADHAGEYKRKKGYRSPPDFLDDSRLVFIFKNELGLVELVYFYKQGIDIDEYIKKTAGMIRFKKEVVR